MNDILTIDPNQAKQVDPNLPPAGYKRDEVLVERADRLAEAAETTGPDLHSIPKDHDVFNPERNREIQDSISKSYLNIGVGHPVYVTKWVNYVNQQGTMVWQAKSDGWMVATTKEFPEARDLVREDNTIRVGDVLLMFIPKDKHAMLEMREQKKRLRQQYGLEANIHDLASRSPAFGRVHTPEIGGDLAHVMQSLDAQAQQRENIRKMAANSVGNMMKRGPIPDVPIK